MKVWIVDQNAHLMYYTFSLCDGIARNGRDVTMVTRGGYEWVEKDPENFSLLQIFLLLSMSIIKRSSLLQKTKPLRMILKGIEYPLGYFLLFVNYYRLKPDILHFQWANIPLFDLLMFRLMRILGIPFVFTVHDVVPHQRKFYQPFIYRLLYKQIKHFVVHSEANKQELSQLYGIPLDRIAVIPHGNYDLFISNDAKITREKARDFFSFSNDDRIVLFFGMILNYKGLIYLIQAMAELKDQTHTKLLIAGKPVEGYRECLNEIERLNLQRRITTRLEFIPMNQLPYFFQAADVVVLPYTETSQSGVIFTAYSFGKPVIATRVGSLPETIEEGKSGLLVPPRDSHSLAKAIDQVFADPENLGAMGAYAKRLSQEKYDWTVIGKSSVNLYEHVLNKKQNNL